MTQNSVYLAQTRAVAQGAHKMEQENKGGSASNEEEKCPKAIKVETTIIAFIRCNWSEDSHFLSKSIISPLSFISKIALEISVARGDPMGKA
ncbi:hypothetical protein AMTR_s00106p00104090 [Amborella trichopoda]|uniref:Uncharacterized protein n=1 Tax=Amborella trichopoda TaxID=13333 RepID=W1P1B0_AMBTC|nr:hypothetical protein AMTR_s00106p00104090 [Amborella trichopoda]